MANPIPGAWARVCLISMWNGTTTMSLAAYMTPSELMNLGDREVEAEPNLAGGRTVSEKPEEDTEITFEGRQVGIGGVTDTTPDGMLSFFYEGTDTAAPFSVDNYLASATRTTYNLWFLWADDSTVSAATGAIVSGANALRCRCACAYFVSCKPNMSDNVLKWTMKFRVPARTISGAKTITWESTDGTAAMASLGTIAST